MSFLLLAKSVNNYLHVWVFIPQLHHRRNHIQALGHHIFALNNDRIRVFMNQKSIVLPERSSGQHTFPTMGICYLKQQLENINILILILA